MVINENEYPPNNQKTLSPVVNAEKKPRPKFTKALQTEVKAVEKSEFRKIVDAFFNLDNIHNMREHIIYRVMIPGAKRIILDSIGSFLGVSNSTMNTIFNTGQNRDYSTRIRRASDGTSQFQNTQKSISAYDYVNISFPSFDDAADILNEMLEILEKYDGLVSVNDFYDLSGYKGQRSSQDCKYGWNDLRRAKIEQLGDGDWIIVFPKAIPLD